MTMIKCAVESTLQKEHDKMRDPKLKNVIFTCPLYQKQICLWCCLHINAIANPLTRVTTGDKHPGYEKKVSEEIGRNWDNIWETCGRCQRH